MASTKAAPDETAAAGIEGAFQLVPLARLVESKTNPRRHFAGLDELTASVKQHGVLTPLLVRKSQWHRIDEEESSELEIIAGARRYRAAKAAKLEAVPVRIMELTDQQALEFQVIENLQRAEVHPLDEAIGYQQLIESVKTDAETGKPY
ncbi:MAG: ParB/RepB/Spo0J family partition protein, partial [Candidatus Acidiferrales bacterium]